MAGTTPMNIWRLGQISMGRQRTAFDVTGVSHVVAALANAR